MTEALPYEFAVVPLKLMVVDDYQRPLTTFVEKIASHFDPALIGTLCVSKRSAKEYAIIDGQTRAEGMKRVGLADAPCIVYLGLSRTDEAQLFAKFQTERRGMTSASRFNAQVIAKDPVAVEINEVVTNLGFTIDHNTMNSPMSLRAVAALEYAYHGATAGRGAKTVKRPDLLSETLETILAAWPKLPDTAKSSVMIRGLAFYLATNEPDSERLVDRLSRVTPSDLAKRAEALREGRGMAGKSPAYMAEAIEAQYRRNTRS